MKPKTLMLFAVATGCGLVAMIGAQQLLASRGQDVERIRVLVARAEVEPGVKLTKDLVAFRDLPKESVPAGAVMQEEQFVERALKIRAFPGQIIQVAQLGEKGQFGTSLDIPAGMRLVTVPASATMIHSGIMKPGDRVDIVLTYKSHRKNSHGPVSLTKTILEYIQVYAMGDQRMGSEAAESGATAKDVKNITLLATPTQTEILKLAESKGQIHLTLRGVLDKQLVASKGTDEAQLEYLRGELSDENLEPQQSEITPEPVAVTPPPPQPALEPAPQASFAEFVETEPKDTTPPAPPEAPKWKMEVFQGDERKVYELDLPVKEVSQDAEPAVRTATGPGKFWMSSVTSWLAGTRGNSSETAKATAK